MYIFIYQVYIYMNTKKSYVYCIYFIFQSVPILCFGQGSRVASKRRSDWRWGFSSLYRRLTNSVGAFLKIKFSCTRCRSFFSGDLHVCDEGRGGCHASFSRTPCFSFLPCRPPPLLASFLASFGLLDLWRRMLPFIENQHIIKKNKKPAKKTNQKKTIQQNKQKSKQRQ